jgi:hypothetical protein
MNSFTNVREIFGLFTPHWHPMSASGPACVETRVFGQASST